MNGYFWLFAICALLSTPVTVHVQIRFGHGIRYRLHLQAAGLPLLNKSKTNASEEEKPLPSMQSPKCLYAERGRILLALFREGYVRQLMKIFRLQSIWLHIRLSFADAAQTALTYALLRAFLHTLVRCCRTTPPLHGHTEANFHFQGTEVFLRCILSTRLGTLTAALIRTGMAVIRLRFKNRTEETHDAKASH